MIHCFWSEFVITPITETINHKYWGPLRIPAGGAAAADASSACRPRAAPLSAHKTDTALCPAVRSLRRFADASLSSYAPVRSSLALRAVSCRAAAHSLGRGCRPEHSLTLAPGLPGEPGNVGWPRTNARGPAGHYGQTGRNTTGRPSRASRRPPENGKQSTKPKERGNPNRSARPPAATRLNHTLNHRSDPAAAAPVPPRGHEKHVSTLRPPFPPSPPSHLIGSAIKAVGRD